MKKTKENSKNVSIEEKIQKRQECNEEILRIISYVATEKPYFRFWQILWLLFSDLSKDRFYEESYDTLEILRKKFEELYKDNIKN